MRLKVKNGPEETNLVMRDERFHEAVLDADAADLLFMLSARHDRLERSGLRWARIRGCEAA